MTEIRALQRAGPLLHVGPDVQRGLAHEEQERRQGTSLPIFPFHCSHAALAPMHHVDESRCLLQR